MEEKKKTKLFFILEKKHTNIVLNFTYFSSSFVTVVVADKSQISEWHTIDVAHGKKKRK